MSLISLRQKNQSPHARTLVVLALFGLLLLTGCVSSNNKPEWQSKYGAVEEHCKNINAEYIYGGIDYEGCIKNGELHIFVCSSNGNCAEIKP